MRQKTQAAVTAETSALKRYQTVIVGQSSLAAFLYFEWCTLLGAVPGAAGIFLRKMFWPKLFGSCGRGTVFGANVTLRHPKRIQLGERVVISDGCILDARSDEEECAISLGENTILSNNVMISCKGGKVTVGARAGVGTQTVIHAVNGSPVAMGRDVLIGPRCYIAGGGNYHDDRTDIPMAQQGLKDEGGVTLEDDIWLGANVTVLPGVTMGKGSIAAAGAVVSKSVQEYSVCGGVPARLLRVRGRTETLAAEAKPAPA